MDGEIRPDLARAFDEIGARYSDTFAVKPGQVAATTWVIEELAGRRGPIVLDVGCGTGLPTARQLIAAGCQVVGIDTSPVMLDEARRNVPEAIFVDRDVNDLDGLHPVESRFDAAVAFFALLVLHRSEVEAALDKLHSVLRTGAPFAIGMVEGDTDYLLREFLGTQVPLTAYPRDRLADLLQRHRFEIHELTAEQWLPSAPGVNEQTHLYARCHAR